MNILSLFKPALNIIDKFVPDKDQAAQLKHDLQQELLRVEVEAMKTVRAEINGKSWLQRNWRPLLMLFFAGCIGARFLGFAPHMTQEEVDWVYRVIMLGLGGYTIGRSVEKVVPQAADAWKEKKRNA